MNTSHKIYDPIEEMIFSKGLRIESLRIYDGKLFIILNTRQVLIDKIENHKRLKSASSQELNEFRFIAKGTGIHWTSLDEDISLYGLLKDYFIKNFQEQSELVIS
jgi:hypothetical protein